MRTGKSDRGVARVSCDRLANCVLWRCAVSVVNMDRRHGLTSGRRLASAAANYAYVRSRRRDRVRVIGVLSVLGKGTTTEQSHNNGENRIFHDLSPSNA
jgi:hypothetical protein